MKIFTLIGGMDGSGKSSLSGVLRQQRSDLGQIIDPDAIAASRHCDRLTAGKIAVQLVERCLEQGVNFTQETTLSGRRILRTIQRAKALDYRIRLYYVGISSAEESLARIENRVRKGGHGIPSADVRRRYAKRYADLFAILPYCDEACFYDNENGFRVVALYQNGEIMLQHMPAPEWVEEMRNAECEMRN